MYDIVVFGTGKCCLEFNKYIDECKINILCYVDNNEAKQGLLFKNKNIISPYELLKEIKYDFIVIASQFDDEILYQLRKMNINEEKIISFYKFIKKLNLVRSCTNDYRLLNENINKLLKSNKIKAIATGLSYGRYGIYCDNLKIKTINLAMDTQDIYYDYAIAEKVINNTTSGIKYCFVGLSYFSFHFDLSKSSCKHRCALIYEKLFGDNHNYDRKKDEYLNKIYYFINKFLRDSFICEYIKNIRRDNNELWNNDFSEMELEDKIASGKRVATIESNKNYYKTVIENVDIIKKYFNLLRDNNIKPIVIVYPVTKYYYDFFDMRLKNEFYTIINNLKNEYNFLIYDYFNSEIFCDSDFMDQSHLNIRGAKKMTGILNSLVTEM